MIMKHMCSPICLFHETLHLVQLIVGLNKGLIKQVDKKGCLLLHHAAQTFPEASVFEFLMSVYPQGLTTLDSQNHLPLHLLMA